VRPSHRVLEIGCGAGHALLLLAAKLPHGELVGIDRSPTQVAAARKRNPGVIVERLALESAVATFGKARFDRVLAINVNVLRMKPEASLPHVVALLRPGGALVLAWESPSRELVAITGRRETKARRKRISRGRASPRP
jgi:SAM-dependent methyltransferase